jgi:hypothetical protein
MSTPHTQEQQVAAQIRQARHAGFANSISHLPPERQKRMGRSYLRQDQNREINYSNFVRSVRGH